MAKNLKNKNRGKAQSSSLGKKNKNCDKCVKYGFLYTEDVDCPKPKCIMCGELLLNGCMKPSLFLRYLEIKYVDYKKKECDIFKRLN